MKKKKEDLRQLAKYLINLPHISEILTDKEKYVLIKRFGLDDNGEITLRKIGEMINYSPERIRQIENKALRKLLTYKRIKHEKEIDIQLKT